MSKIKLNVSLSSEFTTLTRKELKNVVGGFMDQGWCLTNSDCKPILLDCDGDGIRDRVRGHCYRAEKWYPTCHYAGCPEFKLLT